MSEQGTFNVPSLRVFFIRRVTKRSCERILLPKPRNIDVKYVQSRVLSYSPEVNKIIKRGTSIYGVLRSIGETKSNVTKIVIIPDTLIKSYSLPLNLLIEYYLVYRKRDGIFCFVGRVGRETKE